MGRTAGIMGKTVEDIEAIGAYLDSLPPKETKKRMVENKSEAVAMLQKNIEGMRQRGYSLEDIATILAERGVEIAGPTLKSYLQRTKPSSKKPSLKRKASAAGTSPGDGSQAQPASQSQPPAQTIGERAAAALPQTSGNNTSAVAAITRPDRPRI